MFTKNSSSPKINRKKIFINLGFFSLQKEFKKLSFPLKKKK